MSGESNGGKETSPRKGRREGTRGSDCGGGEEKGGEAQGIFYGDKERNLVGKREEGKRRLEW